MKRTRNVSNNYRLDDYAYFIEKYGYDHLLTGRDRLIYADAREINGLRSLVKLNTAGNIDKNSIEIPAELKIDRAADYEPRYRKAVADKLESWDSSRRKSSRWRLTIGTNLSIAGMRRWKCD
jgi:hypothetical protein